jgi:hypothetical protein
MNRRLGGLQSGGLLVVTKIKKSLSLPRIETQSSNP